MSDYKVHVEVAFGKKHQDRIQPNGSYSNTDGGATAIGVPFTGGDLEVRLWFTPDLWTAVSNELWVIAEDESANPVFEFGFVGTNGLIHFKWWNDDGASTVAESTASNSIVDVTGHLALTIDVSAYSVKFYQYPGEWKAPADLADWTQVGAAVTGGGDTLRDGPLTISCGVGQEGTAHELEVWQGLKSGAGTLIANPRFFDPAQYAIGDVAGATEHPDAQDNPWLLVDSGDITGSWIELTDYADIIDYKHGRQHEVGQHEAGTATIQFINDDRRFEYGYASGAYYPDVVPMVPIRILVEDDLVSKPRWTGHVTAWMQNYRGNKGLTTAKCSDAFNLFNRMRIADFDSEVAADAPIGWWKLQETAGANAVDAGSLEVDGTYRNTPTLNQSGPSSAIVAVDFNDATAEDVDVGAFTGSNVAGDMSFGFWMKIDGSDAGATAQGLFQIDVDNTAGIYPLGLALNRGAAPHRLVVVYPDGATWGGVTDFTLLPPDNEWAHVFVTIDWSAETALVYLNGVPGSSPLDLSGWDKTEMTGAMTVQIANAASHGSFDGLITQPQIYDKILSPGRIRAQYRAGLVVFAAETADVRISNMLALADFGGGELLETGVFTLTAIPTIASTLLAMLRRAANSEGGAVFMAPDGRVRLWARDTVGNDFGVSQYTFDELTDVTPQADVNRVFNVIKVTTAGGTIIWATDTASQDAYGEREVSVSSVDVSNADGVILAEARLALSKDPGQRIQTVKYSPEDDPTNLWAVVRDLDLGERITLGYDPPGGGASASIEEHIEAIDVKTSRRGVSRVTMQCSPAS